MEPVSVSLGIIAAMLLSKAAERTGERSVDGASRALAQFASWLRKKLSGEASETLQRVEDAPDSPSRIRELGALLDSYAEQYPEFEKELRAQLEHVRVVDRDRHASGQTIEGNQNVQAADVQGSFQITYGDRPEP